MKVIDIHTLDDCLDRVVTKEFVFDRPTSRPWISALSELGVMEYHGHFPRPFYRVNRKGVFSLKGVEGLHHCQVLFLHHTSEAESDLVRELQQLYPFDSLPNGPEGVPRAVPFELFSKD